MNKITRAICGIAAHKTRKIIIKKRIGRKRLFPSFTTSLNKTNSFQYIFNYFYLYIYPPDSQESDRSSNT